MACEREREAERQQTVFLNSKNYRKVAINCSNQGVLASLLTKGVRTPFKNFVGGPLSSSSFAAPHSRVNTSLALKSPAVCAASTDGFIHAFPPRYNAIHCIPACPPPLLDAFIGHFPPPPPIRRLMLVFPRRSAVPPLPKCVARSMLVPHSSPRPPSRLPYSLYPSTWILPLYLPSQLHRPSSNSRQLQKVSRLGLSTAPELPQRVQVKCNTRAATIDIASFYWSLTGGDAALDGQVCAQCRHVALRRDSRLLHG